MDCASVNVWGYFLCIIRFRGPCEIIPCSIGGNFIDSVLVFLLFSIIVCVVNLTKIAILGVIRHLLNISSLYRTPNFLNY